MKRLFALIAKGLAWYHRQIILGAGYSVRAEAIFETWAQRYSWFFGMKARNHVEVNLGEGTFCYEAPSRRPERTGYLEIFDHGGACLSGDPRAPAATSSQIFAITGPKAQLDSLEQTLFGSASDSL